MKIIKSKELDAAFFQYKEFDDAASVRTIIADIKKRGDKAVRYYSAMFDGVTLDEFRIGEKEIDEASNKVRDDVGRALEVAFKNIEAFSKMQIEQVKEFECEITSGVFTGQKVSPIERVGIYVPAGRFPLISTVLMCAVPARVAGVKEIVLCSPPRYNDSIHPSVLAAAKLSGVKEIYRIGGVQAVAAMAYGTESVKKVDKIIGPGNKYVTQAKKEILGVAGIDFIAGPTEILIIADRTANVDIIAADLCAQAEHDVDAVPILVTTSQILAENIAKAVEDEVKHIGSPEVAVEALENNGYIILVDSVDDAVEIANKKAPEHLSLQVEDTGQYVNKLTSFGSLFIGALAAEVLGDYSAGINHTLPTNRCARYTGGLSVRDFLKIQTTLRVEARGLEQIGPAARVLAEAEGLQGHARSIAIRQRGT